MLSATVIYVSNVISHQIWKSEVEEFVFNALKKTMNPSIHHLNSGKYQWRLGYFSLVCLLVKKENSDFNQLRFV